MDKQERILLLLAGAALVAIIVLKVKPDLLNGIAIPSSSLEDTPTTVAGSIDPATVNPNGPAYLTMAQRYLWGSPVSMYIPGVTEGQVGQVDVATAKNAWVTD